MGQVEATVRERNPVDRMLDFSDEAGKDLPQDGRKRFRVKILGAIACQAFIPKARNV